MLMTMVERTFRKDPNAEKPYGFDWYDTSDADKPPYLESGETITASTWTVPSGITKVSDSFTDTTTTIRLSGGTEGESYIITNTIETSGGPASGRDDERSFEIIITDL